MRFNKISWAILIGYSSLSYAYGENGQLEPVYVTGHSNLSVIGHHTFSNSNLSQSVSADKTLNNVIATLPSVRTSVDAKSSNTQGEIAPYNLSFYGERYYNNNFLINGVSTNDNINPIGLGTSSQLPRARTLTTDPEYLPSGHPQSFWISPDLVENLTVYDSNVPSSYGQFTGAVIEAELKEPDTIRHSGIVSYRTTRDKWTKFHLDGEVSPLFKQAYSPLLQPKFTKHQYHLQVNQPLSDKSAILFAYNRQESFIPQHQRYLNQWDKQKRRSETFLLSYKNELNANNSLLAKLMYSPHFGDYYLDEVKNGGFRESGGGWLAHLNWLNYNHYGLLKTQFSYRDTKNQTEYSSNVLADYVRTKSIDWLSIPYPEDPQFDTSRIGGIGTRFTQQKQWQFKQSLDFKPLKLSNTEHQLSLGWEFQHNRSALRQKEQAEKSNYSTYVMGELFTLQDCTECIPGEQYKHSKVIYHPINAQVKHSRVGLYFQDKIRWKDLTLVPGVRADRGQFIKEWNIAPRFYLDYDVAGRDQTHLIAGYNRYYADDLLDYQLRSAFNIGSEFYRKLDFSGWEYSPKKIFINYQGRKTTTPYSDEINLGISQKFANSLWALKWVQRNSKKQFVTKYDSTLNPGRYYLVNEGKTKTNTLSLEIKNLEPLVLQAVRFDWKFAISYEKSRSNQTIDYTQQDWADLGVKKIIYKNKLRDIDQMPAQAFNDPWTASLQLSSHFPALHLTWLQQLNYTSGSRHYERTRYICNDQVAICNGYEGNAAKVSEYKQPRHLTLDWTFIWRKPLSQNRAFSVDMSVFNVLNRVAKSSIVDDGDNGSYQVYQPGRQFWLGAKFEW